MDPSKTCSVIIFCLSFILLFPCTLRPPYLLISFLTFLSYPTRGISIYSLLFLTFSHAPPDHHTLTHLFHLFSFQLVRLSQNLSASCLQQLGNLDGGVHSPNPWWDLLSKVAQGSTRRCRGLICNRWPTWAPQSQNESALFLSYYRLQQLRGLDGGSNGTHSSRVHHPWGRPWVPYQMWGPDSQSDHLVGPTINRSQNWFSTKSSLSL